MMACHAHALGIREDEVLATILLHDVCEDCAVTVQDLPCSDRVKEAVQLLTFVNDGTTDKIILKQRYFHAIAQIRIACIVKVLDRCNNISTMASAFPIKRLIFYSDILPPPIPFG